MATSTTPTYKVWERMKHRCRDLQTRNAENYVAKGITVCPEWQKSFEAFLRDMGERPEGLSLDRIDNSKGYFKENCRWATAAQQQRNTSRSKLTEAQVKELRGFAQEAGCSQRAIAAVYAKKWGLKFETVREALKARAWAGVQP